MYYQYSIVFFQLLIIGYFALLIPSPYITEGHISFFPIQNLLYVVIAVLTVLSVYDIYKRHKLHANTYELSLSLLSPFPLAALLIVTFLSSTAMPNVNADDYHYGEKILPFYMISKYHLTPYADYALAHGFTDMLPAMGSVLFLDGTASTLAEGNRILTALVVTASFLIAYRYVGLLIAFLLSLLMVPVGIWYFTAIIMSLIIMNVRIEKLGISFFLISLMVFLLAPGQGAVFIIAMLPLVLYRAWSTNTISLNLKYTGMSFVVLLVAAMAMPWIFDMIIAAVKYVLENGSVNFQAYGIAWNRSWDSSRAINSSLEVYEVIRTSWAFVPIFVLVFWLQGYYKDKEKKDAIFYGLFAVIFILIMHKYSLGRIDPFGISRLGVVSKVAVPILFLSVYFLSLSKQKFAYWTIFFVFWMGLLTPSLLHSPINNAKRTIRSLGTLTKGNEINIPNLGNGITNEEHIRRTLAIKKIADQFLDANETFVDVTNRSALYFYLDRRMPVEAVPYNQPHPNMQQRSIDKLSKNPPPMALLKADNINHDGRSVSIRTHRLYRWVIDNYIPVVIDNIIIGVHKSELDRFHKRFSKIILQYSAGILSNITDRNWVKGVSNKHAGFVVARSLENEEKYKIGDKVEFLNGDIRAIKNVTLSKKHIQVYLSGEQINGKAVGYPNKIKVIKEAGVELPNSIEEQLVLWDKVFLLKDLRQLPISWGGSQYTLDEKMETVQIIDFSENVFNNVKQITTGQFQVTGKDPSVVYDVSQYNLSGKDAGLLSFDFKCSNENKKPRLEVYWSADSNLITEKTVVRFNAHNGHIIVPLDAMPRWFFAKHLTRLRIDLQNQNDCKVFTIENLNLSQRILNAK